MTFFGTAEPDGMVEEGRFVTMVGVSVVLHAITLLVVTFFSGFSLSPRINALPAYTPVTVVSVGDLAAPAGKQVTVKKATRQLEGKKPALIQEKMGLKKLEASRMSVEKKTLQPERVAPKPEKPATAAADQNGSDGKTAGRETPAAAAAMPGAESFAVHGLRTGTGGNDIPELTVYTSIILDRIMEAWFLPPSLKQEALKRNLVMVVGIRIDRSGTVTVQGVEQGSGNSLFDSYALSAIKKIQAESFPPLPEVYRNPHLDLGIRFHPSEVNS